MQTVCRCMNVRGVGRRGPDPWLSFQGWPGGGTEARGLSRQDSGPPASPSCYGGRAHTNGSGRGPLADAVTRLCSSREAVRCPHEKVAFGV